MSRLNVDELAWWRQTGYAFELLDVRRDKARKQDGSAIPGARWHDPANWLDWKDQVRRDRPVVLVCAQGHEISQGLSAALVAMGIDARFLSGGHAAWRAAGRPVAPLSADSTEPSCWVTREHPKIDRIACPWLVLRFIDAHAHFLYVPAGEVMAVAERTGAIPYDMPGVKYGHAGDQCSFDAFIAHHGLHDPALDRLALIVRGADTDQLDLCAESAGLLALSRGLSARYPDDQAMLRQGLEIYDSLYAWCRSEVARATA